MFFYILIYLFIIISFPVIAVTAVAKYGFAVAWEEFRVTMVASIICIPLLIITIAMFLDSLKEKEDIEKHKLEEMEKEKAEKARKEAEKAKKVHYICPKCAYLTSALPDQEIECPYCNTMTIHTGINESELQEEINNGKTTLSDAMNIMLKQYVYDSPLYDFEKQMDRITKQTEEITEHIENEKKIHEERALEYSLTSIKDKGLKCPICGSHYVVKIGVLNRAASVHFWGLASSKIGKQYECKDCHHKF